MGKPYKATPYTVRNGSEEFQCFQCGFPVYVGDRALLVNCSTRGAEFSVCSQSCNASDLREWEDIND